MIGSITVIHIGFSKDDSKQRLASKNGVLRSSTLEVTKQQVILLVQLETHTCYILTKHSANKRDPVAKGFSVSKMSQLNGFCSLKKWAADQRHCGACLAWFRFGLREPTNSGFFW